MRTGISLFTILKTASKDGRCSADGFISLLFVMIFLTIVTFCSAMMRITRHNLETLEHLKEVKKMTIKERLILDTFVCRLKGGDSDDFMIEGMMVSVYATDDGYRLISEDLKLDILVEDGVPIDYTH